MSMSNDYMNEAMNEEYYNSVDIVNEGIIAKFKEMLLNKIKKKNNTSSRYESHDYSDEELDELADKWLKDPHVYRDDDYAITVLERIPESKLKSAIKSHIDNFEKEKVDDFVFTDYQLEEINKKCNNPEYIYVVGYDSDMFMFYCKEKNLIFTADYKRVYFD